MVSPKEIWWDRDGKVEIEVDQILFKLPSGAIKLNALGKPDENREPSSIYLSFSADIGFALSTQENLSISDVKGKIQADKAEHDKTN
ncbi:MAG: hypothetical protein JXQ96_18500 [Cyclobacteriaceae bacterium]